MKDGKVYKEYDIDKNSISFLIEKTILHSLRNSPFIVNMTSYNPEKCIIEMEYLDLHLTKMLRYSSEYLVKERTLFFLSLVKGLIDIHKIGFFHRDIKPDNIGGSYTSEPYTLKYFDFNLSHQDVLSSNMMRGTPIYMYPPFLLKEIIFPSREDFIKADIYSLGIIAYEIFHGEHPYRDFDSEDQFYNDLFYKRMKEVDSGDERIDYWIKLLIIDPYPTHLEDILKEFSGPIESPFSFPRIYLFRVEDQMDDSILSFEEYLSIVKSEKPYLFCGKKRRSTVINQFGSAERYFCYQRYGINNSHENISFLVRDLSYLCHQKIIFVNDNLNNIVGSDIKKRDEKKDK